jgi:hypothetical protein
MSMADASCFVYGIPTTDLKGYPVPECCGEPMELVWAKDEDRPWNSGIHKWHCKECDEYQHEDYGHSEESKWLDDVVKHVCKDPFNYGNPPRPVHTCLSAKSGCLVLHLAGYEHNDGGPRSILGIEIASTWNDAVEITPAMIEDAKEQWNDLTEGRFGEGRLWFIGHQT